LNARMDVLSKLLHLAQSSCRSQSREACTPLQCDTAPVTKLPAHLSNEIHLHLRSCCIFLPFGMQGHAWSVLVYLHAHIRSSSTHSRFVKKGTVLLQHAPQLAHPSAAH
jgi:hypothetical protein